MERGRTRSPCSFTFRNQPHSPDSPRTSNGLRCPLAGAVTRPDITVDPSVMREHAYTLIRVLDQDGKAVGPWAPH